MIHENSECLNPNLNSFKEKTLLSKYNIPLDHLSYEYIEQCNAIKELEVIVKILRSGEEGFYPDLTKKAEEKLRLIHPNSRLLTVEKPMLTKYTMEQDDWNETINELKAWTDEMKLKDTELSDKNNNGETANLKYPPVRKDNPKNKPVTPVAEAKVKKRIASTDYKNWDQFDADTEIIKMDVKEEKNKQELKTLQKESKEDDSSRLNEVAAQSEHLSDVEKKYLAEQEKNRGNEFYKAKDYKEAIKYYTSSIAILPTAVAHNNRAMCYLKMCKYTAALEDTNISIKMDPNNVKAYFRRGLALQHKNQFLEALEDMEQVLAKEPNHNIARHIANDLREQCQSMPKKIRLLLEEQDSNGRRKKKIVLVSEEEYNSDPNLQHGIEVNEWGLPKIMCNCNGVPPFVRLTTYPPKIAEHILVKDTKKSNKTSNEDSSNSKASIVEIDREENNGNFYSGDEKIDRPKRLEIMEVESIDECSGVSTDTPSKPTFNVVDMRGKENIDKVESVHNINSFKSETIQKMVNGDTNIKQRDDSATVQSNYDYYKSGAIPKTKMVNGDCYVHSKAIKTNTNIASKEMHDIGELDKCNRKVSVVVANKYKNMIKDYSECNNVPELEEMAELDISVPSKTSVKVTPYHFNSVWISRRPDDLEKQADVLRRVQPSDLPTLIGNKLDDRMLSSVLRCLKIKFDISAEKELVRDYLMALTKCKRFKVIISFLYPKDSAVARELINALHSDESASQLMDEFGLLT